MTDVSSSRFAGYTHWESGCTFAEYFLASYCPSLPEEPWSCNAELGGKFLTGRHTLFRLALSFTRFSGTEEEIPVAMPLSFGGFTTTSPPVNALGIQIGFSLVL